MSAEFCDLCANIATVRLCDDCDDAEAEGYRDARLAFYEARAQAAKEREEAYRRGAEAMRAAIAAALRGPTGGIPVEQVVELVEVPR